MLLDAQPPADLLLDVIRSSLVGSELPPLDLDAYARHHAAFESRSDQRRLITDHLRDRLTERGAGPLAVLSVGCGDGSVDAALADALCAVDPTRGVRYVGVEPFAGSAGAFGARMAGLDHPCLDVEVHVGTFDEAPLSAGYDVVTFVHSMYYVPNVATALRTAFDLLRPGGELLVLSAPRGVLNQLAAVLAPPVGGHPQWFSDDVRAGFAEAGLAVEEPGTLEGRLDLTGAGDDVLDFTVQARLTDELRTQVRAYLAEVALGDDTLLPHPVDVYRVPQAAGT